ncbi:MAG: hypothetical protein KatS3mg114_0527 [Planctomycetaceae bacterium]|nr:MAG: hypothetical protein KatS3mg114_0527 [Planctomycetaceae bacterium]
MVEGLVTAADPGASSWGKLRGEPAEAAASRARVGIPKPAVISTSCRRFPPGKPTTLLDLTRMQDDSLGTQCVLYQIERSLHALGFEYSDFWLHVQSPSRFHTAYDETSSKTREVLGSIVAEQPLRCLPGWIDLKFAQERT